MSFESFEEIINFAIEKEKEAAAFYEDAFHQEVSSGNRKTFEEFAAEERKHQAMLENFSKNKKLPEYQFKWIPDLKRSDYMLDLEYKKDMTYTDLLLVAMKREEHSLKLYNDLRKKAEDEDLITLFKILSQEEARHKNILESFYDDYMAEQGD